MILYPLFFHVSLQELKLYWFLPYFITLPRLAKISVDISQHFVFLILLTKFLFWTLGCAFYVSWTSMNGIYLTWSFLLKSCQPFFVGQINNDPASSEPELCHLIDPYDNNLGKHLSRIHSPAFRTCLSIIPGSLVVRIRRSQKNEYTAAAGVRFPAWELPFLF